MRIFTYDENSRFCTGEGAADLCPGTDQRIAAALARIDEIAAQREANQMAREAHAAQEAALPEGSEPLLALELPFPEADAAEDPEVPEREFLVPAFATTVTPPSNGDPEKAPRFIPDKDDPFNHSLGSWEIVRIPPPPVPRPESVQELWATWHALATEAADVLAGMQADTNTAAMAAQIANKPKELEKHVERAQALQAIRAGLFTALARKSLPEGSVQEVDAAIEARFVELLKDADADVREACEALL